MKVRRKAPEETAMEKRNTSILNFILVAFLPLLLMLFLGFSLDKGEVVNAKNLFEKLTTLKQDHQTLMDNIGKLDSTFSRADLVLDKFKAEKLNQMEKDLRNAEDEYAFDDWDIEKNEQFKIFESYIRTLDIEKDYKENESLNSILNYGKSWIEEFSQARNKELNARKINRKQDLGVEIVSDLQEENQKLNNDLALKDLEILQLKGLLGQNQGTSQMIISSKEEDKSELQEKYKNALEGNEKVKTSIENELKEINENILPDLRGGMFSRDDIKELKEKIKAKLDNIQIEIVKLKTEE